MQGALDNRAVVAEAEQIGLVEDSCSEQFVAGVAPQYCSESAIAGVPYSRCRLVAAAATAQCLANVIDADGRLAMVGRLGDAAALHCIPSFAQLYT